MSTKIPFLSLKTTHAPIADKLYECAKRVIDSGVYINGPECEALATEMAIKFGLGEVVPVSNGLDAIRLILKGYIENGLLHEGDEVILPANTYIATVLPVTEFGLKPVLVSPDMSTYGLDWEDAEKHITEATRALITVHLYGTPSWNFEIAERLKKRNILLIEDNAQAIGASITDPRTGREHYTGSLGDAAAFSFYPTKNVGAIGDAGAVASRDRNLTKTVKALANYGSTRRYYNEYNGFNCRMDEIQAAFLRLKLQHIEETNAQRERNATYYNTLITNPNVILPDRLPDMKQVWHQYVLRTPHRDELRTHLKEAGVATDVHYPLSLFEQPCFTKGANELGRYGNAYEAAKKISSEIVSLPIANITKKEIEQIAALINEMK